MDLLDEFMKYALDHPDIPEELPHDRSLVILPNGETTLERQNRKALRLLRPRGDELVAIRLKATKRKVTKVD